MRVPIPVVCPNCNCDFSVPARADGPFPAALCPECGNTTQFIDHLSISIVADRLLLRSSGEIADDPTLAIICSAIAVECAMTQVFIKWKRIDNEVHGEPTTQQREAWEAEYRKAGRKDKGLSGFENTLNHVTTFLIRQSFHEFVAARVKSINKQAFEASYIHRELFRRRNRIVHWGKVDYTPENALSAFNAACSLISILKLMDSRRSAAL